MNKSAVYISFVSIISLTLSAAESKKNIYSTLVLRQYGTHSRNNITKVHQELKKQEIEQNYGYTNSYLFPEGISCGELPKIVSLEKLSPGTSKRIATPSRRTVEHNGSKIVQDFNEPWLTSLSGISTRIPNYIIPLVVALDLSRTSIYHLSKPELAELKKLCALKVIVLPGDTPINAQLPDEETGKLPFRITYLQNSLEKDQFKKQVKAWARTSNDPGSPFRDLSLS